MTLLGDLLERDDLLAALAARWFDAAAGSGHAVLLAGEAGLGKTSLLRAAAARCAGAAVWWGGCDALQTPLPLAPLHDIAREARPPWQPLLAQGERPALFEAVLDSLRRPRQPVLLVLEDLHWADEATLDLLLYLGRRIDRTSALLLASYRDDEISPALRRVLGALAGSVASRLVLAPLSPGAVAQLARRALREPGRLHAVTRGNPFFVTELLRQGEAAVPARVQDLIQARLERLPAAARSVAQLVAIVPSRAESWLALQHGDTAAIDACLDAGLLLAEAEQGEECLAFRHELARGAVEAVLNARQRRALHAQVLAALEARGNQPAARLVHHAHGAGDAAAIARHAPAAAREAQARGAPREASALYRMALEAAPASPERADWLEALARCSQLADQFDQALGARRTLGQLLTERGDDEACAINLAEQALLLVMLLRQAESDAAIAQAQALLHDRPPGLAQACVFRARAQLAMLAREGRAAVEWADRAIALAEAAGAQEVLVAALQTRGTALLFSDFDAGRATLRRVVALAGAQGQHIVAAQALGNLGSGAGELCQLAEAEVALREAVAYAQRHEVDHFRNYAQAWRALVELQRGRWEEAADCAQDVLQVVGLRSATRVMALVALGRLRTRRGDPGADALLDEALALARDSGSLQRLAPVHAARAEAAWLRGDLAACAREAQAVLDHARRQGHPWFVGELCQWLRVAGVQPPARTVCAEPHALQLEGRWREATAAWAALGCPYEQALALAEGDAPARREALAMLDQLGARPAALMLRRALRADGVAGLPRGRRAATQRNPAQLTARELETLALLCAGLRNSEIAERLCRSVRTVDHHLAAIFAKLGVATRAEAKARAQALGVAAKNG